jgi:hypothetical protein
MHLILSFIIWILIGIACAYFAYQKGRDPYIWFAIGIFLGIFGLLLLIILPAKSEEQDSASKAHATSSIIIDALPEAGRPHHDFLVKDWFYIDQTRQQTGPISFDQLKALWISRKITPSTFAWSEGMPEWKKIQELPELLKQLHSL